jgi:hypothetical protein
MRRAVIVPRRGRHNPTWLSCWSRCQCVRVLDVGWKETIRQYASELLGVSAYQPHRAKSPYGPDLDSPEVVRARENYGGNLAPLPVTRVRWYLRDLEEAQVTADAGYITSAAQLYRAMRRDGTFSGLLNTRSSGLIRLPKRFSGHAAACDALKSRNGTRSVFDELCPSSELELIDQDGVMLGVGIGELVPVPGREYPVLIRLEPEFLYYIWNTGRWFFRSSAGLLPITPGDGRWVLHVPKGRMSPWQFGQWIPCGQAFINKQHAQLHRGNYGGKLANPARVITAPVGASEEQRRGALAQLAAWGINSVFALPVGWQAALLESKGEGHQVWLNDEESSNRDYMLSLAGQVITSEGGKGFSNDKTALSIRADLIQTDGDELAQTVNTQVLPAFLLNGWGEDALSEGCALEWDTALPQHRQSEAAAMVTVSAAIVKLDQALAPHGKQIDVEELVTRFGLPTKPADPAAAAGEEATDERPALRVVDDEAAA